MACRVGEFWSPLSGSDGGGGAWSGEELWASDEQGRARDRGDRKLYTIQAGKVVQIADNAGVFCENIGSGKNLNR